MITLREQITQIIFVGIREINGENTEEDLNMDISQRIAEDKIKKAEVLDSKSIKSCIKNTLEGKADLEMIEPNGAWVYRDETISDWLFNKYDTIADAIRHAITEINATVICDGNVISFDRLSETQAYYVDGRTNELKIVEL